MSARFDDYHGDYQLVAKNVTAVLKGQGGKGLAGDQVDRLILIPETTSPGAVTLQDGTNAAMTIFPGGATSVPSLAPIFVTLKAKSTTGSWTLVVGDNIHVIAVGRFQ